MTKDDAINILLERIDMLDAKLDHLELLDKEYESEWQDTRLEIMATQDMVRELNGEVLG